MFNVRHTLALLLVLGLSACGSTNFGSSADQIAAGSKNSGKSAGKDGNNGSDGKDGDDGKDGAGKDAGGAEDGGGQGSADAGGGKDGKDAGDDNESGKGGSDSDEDGSKDGEGSLKDFDEDVTGFKCPGDLNDAKGKWEGTWTGFGNEGLLEGTISLTMEKLTKKSLQVKDYQIQGGYVGRGNELLSVAFDFILTCDDASFPPVIARYKDGKPYWVLLKFTHQTWNPATIRGVAVGGATEHFNVGGGGTWKMAKNK